MQTAIVTIQTLSPSGHGIADNGWYILGAFPGDVIKAGQYKFAEGISYAEILEIITPSEHRNHTPDESPYFDPNAPWQYLNKNQEDIEKLRIVKDIFQQHNIELCHSGLDPESSEYYSRFRLGGRNDNTLDSSDNTLDHNDNTLDHNDNTLDSSDNILDCNDKPLLQDHYRNKAAYAFTVDKFDNLTFALFTRGVSQKGKITQTENILVHSMINKIGKQFLHFFNQRNVPLKTLKYLTLRYSYHTNTVVAHILVTETSRKKLPWKKSDLETFQNQHTSLRGIAVSHSEQNKRSSTVTKDFYITGDVVITEMILGKTYIYHPSQFFQIYPDAFGQILTDCSNIVSNIPNHNKYELLDFFAGIGIIGLHLADLVHSVHGVEQSSQAGKYARRNAKDNGIENFSFTEANVDTALEYIKQNQILVVDPARSGMTTKSLEKIADVQPEYIIYISCNPETQADDYLQLQSLYDIEWSRVYNLFPKTPHVEHVIFLKRKTN